MKYPLISILPAMLAAAPVVAQHQHHERVAAQSGEAEPPPQAIEGPRHAADAIWGADEMAASRAALKSENGGMVTSVVIIDRLEARFTRGDQIYLWDAQGWYGGDLDKLWLKTEGEGNFSGPVESAEVQALWSHAIGPFFDLQAGARYDFEPTGTAYGVLGVQGLTPYMFEVDAALFLSERGDLTARIEAEYDQKITQRLILQPRAEVELSAQDVPEQEIGAGLSKAEVGLRLRYEITRQFAPYVGIEYEAKAGRTADFARMDGKDPDGAVFLIGIKAWF
ncbi:MAG: copper resistance protein B [Allopontixanthobacter sediminis]